MAALRAPTFRPSVTVPIADPRATWVKGSIDRFLRVAAAASRSSAHVIPFRAGVKSARTGIHLR